MTNTEVQNKIDASFEKLLESADDVDPRLRELLQQKYDEDHIEFSNAVKDAQPSEKSSYWAKKSCQKCYGRGTLGYKHNFVPGQSAKSDVDEESNKYYTNSITKTEVRCSCALKNYQKWLSEFRMFYNMLKAQTIADAVEEFEGDSNNDET